MSNGSQQQHHSFKLRSLFPSQMHWQSKSENVLSELPEIVQKIKYGKSYILNDPSHQ